MAKVLLPKPPAGFRVASGRYAVHHRDGSVDRGDVEKDATEFEVDFKDQHSAMIEFRWIDEQGRESPPTNGVQFNKDQDALEQKADQLGFQP